MNLADLEFRFRLTVNDNNEGILLDNVVLTGSADSRSVPEPGTIALATLGLAVMACRRRGTKAR